MTTIILLGMLGIGSQRPGDDKWPGTEGRDKCGSGSKPNQQK